VPSNDPIDVVYPRSGPDSGPDSGSDAGSPLVWRGLDDSALEVRAPALRVRETVNPKDILDGLARAGKADVPDLFAGHDGFSGCTAGFYRHAERPNSMILGDSLQIMAGLGERENLGNYMPKSHFLSKDGHFRLACPNSLFNVRA